MKLFIAIFVLFVVCLATSQIVFGQKNRDFSLKTDRPEAAVIINSAEALTDGKGVYVRWSTARETDNLGFYVFRIQGGKKEIVNNRFVAGSRLKDRHETLYDQKYGLFDANGTPQSQYMVESFEANGRRTSTGSITPILVATVSGLSETASQDLSRSKQENTVISTSGLVYSKEVKNGIEAGAQFADPINQRWVAAQPGAKIGVRQTGMYRVTKAQLSAAGFNVSADPSLWQLYSNGVEQAIIVDPAGNYFDFYGKAIDTIESDTAMYYLVVGSQPGLRMTNSSFRPNLSTVKAQSYDASVTVKERQNYLVDYLNGDGENYVGHFIGAFNSTTNISLPAVDTSAFSAHVFVRILGYTTANHTFSFSLNGHALGQVTGSNIQLMSLDMDVPISYLVEGTNALVSTSLNGNDFGFFDQVQITYKRRYVSDQNKLSFTAQNFRGAKLESFSSSNIRIFDITNDGNPVLMNGAVITPNGNAFDATIPAYRSRVMYAVEDSGLLAPASVTSNAPSTLSTSAHNANLVIISYKDFITQANAWADYRRGQGFSVEVVNVEDVYDEFNYGVLSANSVRDFLNFARQNWQTAPSYVLLVGDGSYDPRNYEGNGFWDLIPTKFFDSPYDENPSDDALVDFNNDGLAEMAIGRIPARTTAMVTNAFNKTVSFETNITPQNITRGFTCQYDNPIGWDFQGMCQQMADQFPVGTTTVLLPRMDTSPNGPLVTELNNGRYFVNYSGHGSTGAWEGNNFNVSNVPLLTNINSLSVYTMLTCLNGYFVGTNVSMGEALLNSTTGGGVAAWASTGETTPDIQQIMGVHFYGQLVAGQIPRLGDLIIDAKTVVSGGRDVRLSWVLIGDPMLKVR